MLTVASLLHLLVASVLGWRFVVAKHFTCNYSPGPKSPSTYGYQKFCSAGKNNPLNSTDVAIYQCISDLQGNTTLRVADWGFIEPKTFEMGGSQGIHTADLVQALKRHL